MEVLTSRFWEGDNVDSVSFRLVSIGGRSDLWFLNACALTDPGPGLISPEDVRCSHMGSGPSILIDRLSCKISLKI